MLDTMEILERLGGCVTTWKEREEYYTRPSSGWPSDAVRGCRKDIEKLIADIVSGSSVQ
mgnify:CR=1 FL=1